MPKFSEFLFGSKPKLKKDPTGTSLQTQFGGTDLIKMLQQMSGDGGGFNQANQYDQSLLGGAPGQDGQQGAYEQFANPYMQQFNEQVLPGIAERFAGAGALSSSGFGQALGGAASGLQSQLAQLFSSLQGQAAQRQQGQFQNLSQLGLGYSPFSYREKQGSQGFLAPLLTSLAGGLAGGLTGGLSGLGGLFGGGSGGVGPAAFGAQQAPALRGALAGIR